MIMGAQEEKDDAMEEIRVLATVRNENVVSRPYLLALMQENARKRTKSLT